MKELVMSEKQIVEACARIGKELTERLKDEEKFPLFICVMKGALYFMAELRKHCDFPSLDSFIQVTSYQGTHTTGHVVLSYAPKVDLEGRTVVLVEDVVDTGLSMEFLVNHFKTKGNAKQVLICALFDKKPARKVPVEVDYVGMTLEENKFLLGFGLDYNGLGRNVPYVYVPTPEEIAQMDKQIALRGEHLDE